MLQKNCFRLDFPTCATHSDFGKHCVGGHPSTWAMLMLRHRIFESILLVFLLLLEKSLGMFSLVEFFLIPYVSYTISIRRMACVSTGITHKDEVNVRMLWTLLPSKKCSLASESFMRGNFCFVTWMIWSAKVRCVRGVDDSMRSYNETNGAADRLNFILSNFLLGDSDDIFG